MRLWLIPVIIIACIVSIFLVQVLYAVVMNVYAGMLLSSVSDEDWETEFAEIAVVKRFIESHPDYTVWHDGEYLGWKVIHYQAQIPAGTIQLDIKKSVLHGKIVVLFVGCYAEYNSETHIPGTSIIPIDGVHRIEPEKAVDVLENLKCT